MIKFYDSCSLVAKFSSFDNVPGIVRFDVSEIYSLEITKEAVSPKFAKREIIRYSRFCKTADEMWAFFYEVAREEKMV